MLQMWIFLLLLCNAILDVAANNLSRISVSLTELLCVCRIHTWNHLYQKVHLMRFVQIGFFKSFECCICLPIGNNIAILCPCTVFKPNWICDLNAYVRRCHEMFAFVKNRVFLFFFSFMVKFTCFNRLEITVKVASRSHYSIIFTHHLEMAWCICTIV